MIAHWDDVERTRRDVGPLAMWMTDLGTAAGSRRIGATRYQVDAQKRSSPVHVEGDEEEIFFVLGGSGLAYHDDLGGAPRTHEIRPGDCIVHRVEEEAHTFIAGAEGLDLLAFGERTNFTGTYLPRARVVRVGPTLDVSPGPHPWEREAAAGGLELPPPSPRPPNIVNADELDGDHGGRRKRLGLRAGSERTGLNLATLGPGEEGAEPHVHSAEEELFVILDGTGVLDLIPSPFLEQHGRQRERRDLRAGHVVSRHAGTGIAHHIRAGDAGLTYLAYGERKPEDVIHYPRSGETYFRGLGLVAKLPGTVPRQDV